MSDGGGSAADALDNEAERRRRGRNPGGSRTAGRRPTAEERTALREAERLARQQRKDAEAKAKAEAAAAAAAGEQTEGEQMEPPADPPQEERRGGKRPRPKAIPFYPDPLMRIFCGR